MLSAGSRLDRGATLLEVLVTLGIMAFGLLGLAGLENKIQLANVESYQRAQASLVLANMVERMNVAPAINATSVSCYSLSTDALTNACLASRVEGYVSATVFGTGDTTEPSPCPTAAGAARDQCEWSATLRGESEVQASSANVGAMAAARGCITRLQAPNPTPAVCTPGIYLVSVAWQGYNKTAAPSIACGTGLYGDESLRRVVAARVVVGLPGCV
jgi:type IV pilus assembly protein PilV